MTSSSPAILFFPTPYELLDEQQGRLLQLRGMLPGCRIHLKKEVPPTQSAIEQILHINKLDCVITTNPAMLALALGSAVYSSYTPTIDNYAGSLIRIPRRIFKDKDPVDVLIINPLEQLHTVPEGKFVTSRHLSKLTKPDSWWKPSPFVWSMVNVANYKTVIAQLNTADLIAVDIETDRPARNIKCVSYTAVWLNEGGGKTVTMSYVLAIKEMADVFLMRQLNLLRPAKILQNGKFDSALFFRFSAPLYNWKWDTMSMFHAWYAELPKTLAFITTFALRDVAFWKDEGKTGLLEDFYRYNARDGWATANALLSMLSELPTWAMRNYLMSFPRLFPSHLAEMTGVRIDREMLLRVKKRKEAENQHMTGELNTMLGTKNFNPGSPKQVVSLLQALGNKDVKTSKESVLRKVMFQHPVFHRILEKVISIREHRKLISSYLDETKLWGNQLLYSINPPGTTTGRLAGTDSSYECGWSIHTIPRDEEIKQMYIAEDGFHLAEGDFEQAEARDVAYLSGDKNLLATVHSDKDYHALNAERFFGTPYTDIIDESGKVVDKVIRNLSKRTNHGANYNMGADVLVETMGLKLLMQAAAMLKLPAWWSARQIAQHLLDSYDKAYPTVRGQYYEKIVYIIITTKMLVSPTGWTRYCFADPRKGKHYLNQYVAHPSQNLNAETLNAAVMKVFYTVALKYPEHFRLHAQIHDSIFFSYRIGYTWLIELVYRCMLMEVPVTDIRGTTRGLVVPIGMKYGDTRWSNLKAWKNTNPLSAKLDTIPQEVHTVLNQPCQPWKWQPPTGLNF